MGDWIGPDTTPMQPRAGAQCGDLLEAGQRWVCRPCVAAAENDEPASSASRS